MLLEFSTSWPFVRRHRQTVPVVHPMPVYPGHTRHGTPHHAHRSWVKTEHGVGWIHHHDPDGYTVEFEDGRLLKCKHTQHVEAPK